MASYKDYKSVSAAQKAGSMYFLGKDGKKKLAVTKEQLDSWKKKNKGKYKGSALTAWANNKGKNIKGAASGAPSSSPRPRLRPGSAAIDIMTPAEKKEVAAANKRNQEVRDKKSGKTDTLRGAAKFRAWYKKNGSKYSKMKDAFEAWQKTLRSGNSKGGLAKGKKK